MKVLEVTTTTRVRDPHRPLTHTLTQNDLFKASDGYEFKLHASGLAVYVKGRDHTILAPMARAVVVADAYDPEWIDPVCAPEVMTTEVIKPKGKRR